MKESIELNNTPAETNETEPMINRSKYNFEMEKVFSNHVKNIFENNTENKIESWTKVLDEKLKIITEEIVTKYSDKDSMLLNVDTTLNPTGFYRRYKNEGIYYDNNEIKENNRTVRSRIGKWIEKRGKSMKTYITESDITFSIEEFDRMSESHALKGKDFWNSSDDQKAVDAIIEQYDKDREKMFGVLWEKAKTVLCNEMLGSEFVTIRSSKFDDLQNGIDNIIIEESNGNVVCAFDEVNAPDESALHMKKLDKVEFENEQGGATIKYGVTIKDKKIVRKKFENIPIFALQISLDNLVNLLEALSSTDKKEERNNNMVKIEIFDKLLNSLKDQTYNLMRKNIKNSESSDIASFEDLLDLLRNQESKLDYTSLNIFCLSLEKIERIINSKKEEILNEKV